MLAVAIFAIVLVAMNTVFYSGLRLQRTMTRSLDQAAPVQQALTQIRRDLQGVLPPGGSNTLAGDFRCGTISSGMGKGQTTGIEFYSTTGILRDDAPWGNVQRISYQLRAALNRTARGKDLYRCVTRNLLPTMAEDADEQWLMGDVESLDFLCYTGTDWRDSWDTSLSDTNLPTAVQVRLLLASDTGLSSRTRQPTQLIVPLMAQSSANSTNTTDTSTGGGQ
jgi:hypothetical protein